MSVYRFENAVIFIFISSLLSYLTNYIYYYYTSFIIFTFFLFITIIILHNLPAFNILLQTVLSFQFAVAARKAHEMRSYRRKQI